MALATTPEISDVHSKPNDPLVYRVVLTGGPCAGKTTALVRLRTYFEDLGWTVYSVPETATLLLGGGVKYENLNVEQQKSFNESIVRTMMNVEQTFMELAKLGSKKCLIVCDRGVMDPSAFCSSEEWDGMMARNNWNSVEIRDERYDQIIHMVSAAKGAESFYQLTNNAVRSEGLELARERDESAAQAWVGHPCCDVIDNSTDFENKLNRVISVVCKRLKKVQGADIDIKRGGLEANSRKRKFLVKEIKSFTVHYEDFDVQHDYLITTDPSVESRIRRRGQQGYFTYTLTERRVINGERVDQLRQIKSREYKLLLKQRDPTHFSICKTRRCFIWQSQFYHLDIFKEPQNLICRSLALLEVYTVAKGEFPLPSFLVIDKEVTGDLEYSMHKLSKQPAEQLPAHQ